MIGLTATPSWDRSVEEHAAARDARGGAGTPINAAAAIPTSARLPAGRPPVALDT
ncbi:MAG TPA: hypothetical protein VIJ51_18065 [Solirubrobacteraceae bacterium]